MAKTPSPFDFSGPSSFVADKTMRPARDGLSLSQLATKNVQRRTEAAGRSPNVIYGLSRKADKQLHVGKGKR
ncbi:MAG TPA: hypothetical protein VIL30_24475 [Ramlibacter sp.]|jgi:hypothetical protein